MIVLGAGGFAKELTQILISDKYGFNEKDLFFFDDVNNVDRRLFNKFPILNSTTRVKEIFKTVSPEYCLGVGSSKARYLLYKKFEKLGGRIKTIIANNSTIGIYEMDIHEGVTIMSEVILSNSVSIGKYSLINVNVMIGHDSVIGDFCDISPGVIITGHVHIGNYVQIGSGAIILPGIKIGESSIISAGSVISQDIPENSKVVGTIPSRVIEKLPPFDR